MVNAAAEVHILARPTSDVEAAVESCLGPTGDVELSPASDSEGEIETQTQTEAAPTSRKPRKQASKTADPDPTGLAWLSELLDSLQPKDPEPPEPDLKQAATDKQFSFDPGDGSESRGRRAIKGSGDIQAAARSLVQQSFALSRQFVSSEREAVDDLEAGEAKDIEELSRESGLDALAQKEAKLMERACQNFAKMSRPSVSKSPLLESNVAAAMSSFVQAGMEPEDAAVEAILNNSQLLGNEEMFGDAGADDVTAQIGADEPETAESADGAARLAAIADAFNRWQDECCNSIKALQSRCQALQEKTVGQNGELSLVRGNIAGEPKPDAGSGSGTAANPAADTSDSSESVFWVHWSFKSSDYGRPASLDAANRVKCIVATGSLRDPRDYRQVAIVHPAIGVRMERIRGWKGQSRPQVPEDVMRVYRIWQAALVSRDNISSFEPCYICKRSETADAGLGLPDELQQQPAARVCPLCLLPSHPQCCTCVVEFGNRHGCSFPDGLDVASLEAPDVFEKPDVQRQPLLGCKCQSPESRLIFAGNFVSPALQLFVFAN